MLIEVDQSEFRKSKARTGSPKTIALGSSLPRRMRTFNRARETERARQSEMKQKSPFRWPEPHMPLPRNEKILPKVSTPSPKSLHYHRYQHQSRCLALRAKLASETADSYCCAAAPALTPTRFKMLGCWVRSLGKHQHQCPEPHTRVTGCLPAAQRSPAVKMAPH